MIDKHAPQIVTANGEQSPQTILPCSVNASTDRADDQGPLEETVASVSKTAAVRFPLPSSHSDEPETAENRHPDRESNRASGQSPATRSIPPQISEKTQESASQKDDLRACNTKVSHFSNSISSATLSNRSRNRPRDCHTRSSHQRSARGLWLRGSVWQFRVKVPVDLRQALGRVDLNRSLRTDSRSLAIRLSRVWKQYFGARARAHRHSRSSHPTEIEKYSDQLRQQPQYGKYT
jgi:hypothetical protein